jgi:leucyl/phenylalanyl-tRNA---protein transferase
MPLFRLTDDLVFPPPYYAEPDGLLAIGGDLSPERLLLAYRMGIFPWYSSDMPILWWSPDPRLVLFPGELKISKSLRKVLRKRVFEVTFDRDFRAVIERCAELRREQGDTTWIVPEMKEAYDRIHRLGYAHSVECRHDGDLVGGLYGVALGRIFYGESMFTEQTDASKVAFVHLVRLLMHLKFHLIDCQVTTAHLRRFGAIEIPRHEFLHRLSVAVDAKPLRGSWASVAPPELFQGPF